MFCYTIKTHDVHLFSFEVGHGIGSLLSEDDVEDSVGPAGRCVHVRGSHRPVVIAGFFSSPNEFNSFRNNK